MKSHSAAPEIVLLSGLLCDDCVWRGVLSHLSTVPTRTVSFPNFDSIQAMASHVLDVSPSKFILVGHSMGGRVALEVYKRAPERVLGLALMNTGVHGVRDHEPQSRGKLVELAKREGMKALANVWLPPMLANEGRDIPELMNDLVSMVMRSTPDSFHAQITALLNREEAKPILSQITKPTLLLSGDLDKWSPFSQHQEMSKFVRGAKLVLVSGAGHMALVEQPVIVSAAIAQLYEKVICESK